MKVLRFSTAIGQRTQMPKMQKMSQMRSNGFKFSALNILPIYGLRQFAVLFSTKTAAFRPKQASTTSSGVGKEVKQRTPKGPVDQQLRPTMVEDSDIPKSKVFGITPCEEFDLTKVINMMKINQTYNWEMITEERDVMRLEPKYAPPEKNFVFDYNDIFIFSEGTIVFWNTPEAQRHQLCDLLKPCQTGPYDPSLVKRESDEMEYSYTTSKTCLAMDKIYLEKKLDETTGMNKDKFEKFAFSNAISSSLKMGIWEQQLADVFDFMEDLCRQLKIGTLRENRKQVMKHAGELVSLRLNINLTQDVVSAPDFYWDRTVLEGLYENTCRYFNIERRAKVMNDKLNYCFEILHLVDSNVKDRKALRIEWLIAILICIEICFEIVAYYERQNFSHVEEQNR